MIATGISLSVSAVPLGFLLSLMAEARGRVERVLFSIELVDWKIGAFGCSAASLLENKRMRL
jgi:hypothetical protein